MKQAGYVRGSRNERLNEAAYRRYESHIREGIRNWNSVPSRETQFAVPSGMSPNTFAHGLRDALQSIKLFSYDPEVQSALAAIREEIVIALAPAGDAVWFRAKGKQGRPVQVHFGTTHNRPSIASLTNIIHPNPDEETLRAFCVLGAKGLRAEGVQFKGRVMSETIAKFELEFDTAFAYDEASDVTTML